MAWLTGWAKRQQIDVQPANVDATLSDFPLLVKFTDNADLADALATGYDIRFTTSDGETTIPYERESWSGGGSSNVTAIFWVKISSISSVSGATIYIYWVKADAEDGADSTNVWTVYDGVWHMDDNPNTSTIQDSTSGNHDGTKSSSSVFTEASGKIGKSQDCSNAYDVRIDLGDTEWMDDNTSWSMDCWIKGDTSLSANYPGIAHFLMNGSIVGMMLYYGSYFGLVYGSSIRYYCSGPVHDGETWVHVSCTNNSGTYHIYFDGVEQSKSATTDSATGTGNKLFSLYNDYYGMKGEIDEVRVVSGTALSDAWWKFQVANTNEADNELTFGEIETEPVSATINISIFKRKKSIYRR